MGVVGRIGRVGRGLVGRVGVTRWWAGGRRGRVGERLGKQDSGSHCRMGAWFDEDAQQAGCPNVGRLPGERKHPAGPAVQCSIGHFPPVGLNASRGARVPAGGAGELTALPTAVRLLTSAWIRPARRRRRCDRAVQAPLSRRLRCQGRGSNRQVRHGSAGIRVHRCILQGQSEGRALDGKQKERVNGGTAPLIATPTALAPLRPPSHFLACLTLAAGGVRLYAAECGDWGAIPHHAVLGRGAGGHIGGGACMPWGGDAHVPSAPNLVTKEAIKVGRCNPHKKSAVRTCLVLPSLGAAGNHASAAATTATAIDPLTIQPPAGRGPQKRFQLALAAPAASKVKGHWTL